MRTKLLSILGIIILLLVTTISSGCAEKVPVFIQFHDNCDYYELVPGDVRREIQMTEFVLIGSDATMDQIKELNEHVCVIRTFRPAELSKVIHQLQGDFDSDRDSYFEEMKLKRGLEKQDVIDREDLKDLLEGENPEANWPGGIISSYQLYVTPDASAVQNLADQLDGVQEIYDEALSWVWVSEEYLNGVPEKWYYPEGFLTLTPDLANNPSPGDMASDCSEQANTLASLLIADGWSEDNVRVVLGMVDFQGQSGGHAWVEINENGQWFALEATAGAYYEESTNTLTPATSVPYKYFRYATYPVEEVWYYYNNEYFWDEENSVGNAPPEFRMPSQSWLQQDLQNFHSKMKN